MALFSSRSAGRKGESGATSNDASETVEAMRTRARHRLIGAAVLVAAGVIAFPMLFDTQPRPIAVDIPIEIPDKNKLVPLAAAPSSRDAQATATATATATSSATPAAANAGVTAQGSLGNREEIVAAAGARPGAESGPSQRASAAESSEVESRPAPDNQTDRSRKAGADRSGDKPQDKPATAAAQTRPDSKPPANEDVRVAKAEEAARARALLQGKSEREAAAAASAAEGRYIVQIGAFAEPERARATRAKVEGAGLKTYTQETKTASGTWIRVRVGPFATRAEADAAASKIKGLSLPASILSL